MLNTMCVCLSQLPWPADCASEHSRHDHPQNMPLLPAKSLPRGLLEEFTNQGRPAAISRPPCQGGGGLLQVSQCPYCRYISRTSFRHPVDNLRNVPRLEVMVTDSCPVPRDQDITCKPHKRLRDKSLEELLSSAAVACTCEEKSHLHES